MKKVFKTIGLILLAIILICAFIGSTNKTFFKTTYIGVQNQKIFIPRYSFFERETGLTCAIFYSLKSEKTLKKEINNYMKDFEYFEDSTTYGYKKGNLFIQSYEVTDRGLFRKIYITY